VVFLLSPASCAGRRAQLLLRDAADFPLARRIRSREGAPLGEIFSFLSGLYFRGKLTYAARFASPPAGVRGIHVITTSRGLLDPAEPVTIGPLREFAAVSLDAANPRYREPLQADAHALAAATPNARVVLLGSIATGKYADVLLDVFGERLCFPEEFVGRGDMSRGGLLLRAADAGEELEYVALAGAIRRGRRPPRLVPRPQPWPRS
jgi:hypothetical protein